MKPSLEARVTAIEGKLNMLDLPPFEILCASEALGKAMGPTANLFTFEDIKKYGGSVYKMWCGCKQATITTYPGNFEPGIVRPDPNIPWKQKEVL